MENCSVKTYKGNVENDNLERFDEILIKVVPVTNSSNATQQLNARPFGTYGNEEFECTIEGNGNFISGSYSGTNIGKTCVLDKNFQYVYLSNGTYNVRIKNKYKVTDGRFSMCRADIKQVEYCDIVQYGSNSSILQNIMTGDISYMHKWDNITYVGIANSEMEGNIEALAGKTSLTTMEAYNSKITGDIAAFADCTALTTLAIASCPDRGNIYGNVTSLGKLINLTTLDVLVNTNVEGSIESLVQAWRTNGRTEGSVSGNFYFGLGGGQSLVTWKGDPIPRERTNDRLGISWTSTTITYNGETITA